jgi:hypothetical protein
MSDLAVSLTAAACVFAGGVIGLQLHRVLPNHCPSSNALGHWGS